MNQATKNAFAVASAVLLAAGLALMYAYYYVPVDELSNDIDAMRVILYQLRLGIFAALFFPLGIILGLVAWGGEIKKIFKRVVN